MCFRVLAPVHSSRVESVLRPLEVGLQLELLFLQVLMLQGMASVLVDSFLLLANLVFPEPEALLEDLASRDQIDWYHLVVALEVA